MSTIKHLLLMGLISMEQSITGLEKENNHLLEETFLFTMENEYTPEYCLELEAAYGDGMMSEGGIEAIEHMFDGISLNHVKALDIGSGLGGVAFYLAEKYDADVTGLEVNPWMVEESNKRIPQFLAEKIRFVLSKSNTDWNFSENSFDIIYSKGVLTHIETKDELFLECKRLLKSEGTLVITDWLSSELKAWGNNIQRLVELENLILFPESESGYRKVLEKNGFTLISVRDDSAIYKQYNQAIVNKLTLIKNQTNDLDKAALEASIDGYQSIVKAIEEGELRVLCFIARKQ